MNNKLSSYIINECKRQNLSTEALAKKSDLSEDYLRKIKRNVIKSISIDSLRSIARGLDIPFKTFLEEIGEIDLLCSYILNENDSLSLVALLEPFSTICNIDFELLSNSEKIEIANYIMYNLYMISPRYKR